MPQQSRLKKSLILLREINRARLLQKKLLVSSLEAKLRRYYYDAIDRQLPLFDVTK
jgi:hypothetical protein